MIELKGLTKRFDGTTVLDSVDLHIETGSTFGLLGSNGAGKSTILRLLSGIYRPDGGEVRIDGEAVYDNVPIKERVFFINDETVQFANYTLDEMKALYKRFYPRFSEELFAKLQKAIHLPTDKKLSTFSKGMKRQAVVIIGLACNTDYLLLDEAFDGLDPTMRIIVKRMLVDAMLDRGLTTVISSHNLTEINEVCDTVSLLHNGKFVFSRDLDSVKSGIHKLQLVFAPDSDPVTPERLTDLGMQVLHFDRSASVYHIIARGEELELREQLAPLSPIVSDIIPLTLEEIFIYELEVLGYDSNAIDRLSEEKPLSE